MVIAYLLGELLHTDPARTMRCQHYKQSKLVCEASGSCTDRLRTLNIPS
jgi:hypothetical protein